MVTWWCDVLTLLNAYRYCFDKNNTNRWKTLIKARNNILCCIFFRNYSHPDSNTYLINIEVIVTWLALECEGELESWQRLPFCGCERREVGLVADARSSAASCRFSRLWIIYNIVMFVECCWSDVTVSSHVECTCVSSVCIYLDGTSSPRPL